MSEEDSTREIFGYTSHKPVPTWAEKGSSSTCLHCSVKFSSLKEATKPHNCRLCGQLVCTSCTGKYHVPIVYEKKGKKGPTRVCFPCRDSCLAEKNREQTAATQRSQTKHAVLSMNDLDAPLATPPPPPPRETNILAHSSASNPSSAPGSPPMAVAQGDMSQLDIYPPAEWDEPSKYPTCFKCHRKVGHRHNCRTCGKLFCEPCTTKMLVPPQFERKKNKVGQPARVCGECRFKILGGAKLVERTVHAEGGSSSSSSSTSNTLNCIAPGCTAARVSKNGYCAVHVNEFGGGGSELAAAASISIRWEGEHALLTRVALVDGDMTLAQIDVAVRKQVEELRERKDFEYLYKNEGIAEVFHDIFTAEAFAAQGNQLYIRKKVDTARLVAEYTGTTQTNKKEAAAKKKGTAAGAKAGGKGKKNPFLVSSQSQAQSLVVKAAPKPAVRQPPPRAFKKPAPFTYRPILMRTNMRVIHKKPAQTARVSAAVTPVEGGAPPPPPPPARSLADAPPLASLDLLKERAKQFFGQQ